MKRLLLIAAALFLPVCAHASQWYYVNLGDVPVGSPRQCIAIHGDQDPATSLTAALGSKNIRTDMDMTLADGSQFMVFDHNGTKYAFATTVERCMAVRNQLERQFAEISANQDKWYVAQYRGDCVQLSAMFSGVKTPAELHKAMTRKGSHLSLERRGDDIALLSDDLGHYPPLVMVHGLAKCEASSAAILAAQ